MGRLQSLKSRKEFLFFHTFACHKMVFSKNSRNFNPHPLFPAPTRVGGEKAEKQGIASAFSLGSPCFSGESISKNS
jgi:hypothetical protein